MSEIEKMKRYIDKHGAPHNLRYEMSVKETLAIVDGDMSIFNAVNLAFAYGKAKGYRAAKAEVRR